MFVFVFIMSVCKSKWTGLRNSFARELCELKNKKSGSAGSKKENRTFLTVRVF